VDAEVEVDGEEEVQLQRVELGEGDAADLRPAMLKKSRRTDIHSTCLKLTSLC
jgi:hypothetical protein